MKATRHAFSTALFSPFAAAWLRYRAFDNAGGFFADLVGVRLLSPELCWLASHHQLCSPPGEHCHGITYTVTGHFQLTSASARIDTLSMIEMLWARNFPRSCEFQMVLLRVNPKMPAPA
jgi:hypothetical protein